MPGARQYIAITTCFAFAATVLVACVEGDGPFLSDKSGLIDPYFEGTFNYEGMNHVARRVELTRTGGLYRVEDGGEFKGDASIHSFRDGLLIAQLRRGEPLQGRPPYLYFLVRKTQSGFDLSGICRKASGTCEAKSTRDLISKLDRQANTLLRHSEAWVALRKGRPGHTSEAVSKTQDTSENCNSDDSSRKLAGCSALIEKAELGAADLALAYSRRSDVYIASRDFDRAISDRKRAFELQPNDDNHRTRLSAAYQMRAATIEKLNGARAIDDLTEAIRIDPTNHDARLQRSSVYAAQRKLTDAIRDAEEALKDEAKTTNVVWLASLLAQRATELMQSSDVPAAITMLTKAIKLEPNRPELLVQRGDAQAAKGDYSLAIADYSDALHIKPDYLSVLLRRSDAYSRTGQLTQGLSDADAAVKLDNKNVNALLARALAREARGDFKAARQDYATVLALDSKQAVAKAGVERAKQQEDASARLEQLSREQSLLTEVSPATNVAVAPTFNCAKASSQDEVAICNSRPLAFLDRELDTTYRRLQKTLTVIEESGRLKLEQGDWLRQRRQCQSDIDCIAERYRSRMLELQNWQSPKQLQE